MSFHLEENYLFHSSLNICNQGDISLSFNLNPILFCNDHDIVSHNSHYTICNLIRSSASLGWITIHYQFYILITNNMEQKKTII